MKRTAICLVLLLTLCLNACGGKSKEAKAADDLISSIGEVTLESESKIEAAEQAVSALNAEDKERLEGTETLAAARKSYDTLVQEAAVAQEAADVEAVINAIGEVTLEREEAIGAARKA